MHRLRKYTTTPTMIYLCKSQTPPQKKWSTAALSLLELPSHHFPSLIIFNVNHTFSNIHNITSLSFMYRYIHMFWLAPLLQAFAIKTRHTTFPGSDNLHSIRIQSVHADSIFPRTATLWERLLCGFFHEEYNHQVQRQPFSIPHIVTISYFLLLRLNHSAHSGTVYLEVLLSLVLREQ